MLASQGHRTANSLHATAIGIINFKIISPIVVPLVAFLDLMHLRVPLAIFVLGRTGCIDQWGINDGAGLEHEPLSSRGGVYDKQRHSGQFVFFEQVPIDSAK